MEFINNYLDLESSSYFIGVEKKRYGGGFYAICCRRGWVDFLFECLRGGDMEAFQTQSFLIEVSIFPAAFGNTASEALTLLDRKFSVLYKFDKINEIVIPQFKLTAKHDIDPGDEQTYYDFQWDDIAKDLYDSYQKSPEFYFENAKIEATDLIYRNLYSALTADVPSELVAI